MITKYYVTCFCSNHRKAHPAPRASMLSSRNYHTTVGQHSTAQHSAISHAQSSEARTCRSECDNASKQTRVGESQHVVEHLHLAVIKIQRRNPILPGAKKKTRSTSRIKQLLLMREGLAFISNLNATILRNTLLPLSYL